MSKTFLGSFILGLWGFTANAQTNTFEAMLQCYNTADAPGMVVRLEQADQLIYTGALGLADIETGKALEVDDIFQIGSVTKTFTAAAILKLEEENKLTLQDTLGQFIPDLNPQYKPLTLQRVLSHTSGLPDYLGDPTVTSIWNKYASVDEVIDAISKQPLLWEPGKKYSYSSLGYILLGKVIEVVSGVPYDQYMAQTFFEPLNMKHTFVVTQGTQAGNVKGYTTHRDAPDTFLDPKASRDRPWHVDRSWIYSAGAIASTLGDMSKWNKALTNGQVITEESYHLMTTKAVLDNSSTINYGFGLDIFPIGGLASVSHQGLVPGFFSWNVYFPEQNLSATALSNLDTKHPGPALLDMIARHLQISPRPLTDKEKLVELTKKLVGRYRGADSKTLKITSENLQLFAQTGRGKKRRLVPRENSSFSYECTEDYFTLRESGNKIELLPVRIYQGEQPPLVKL